jgi:hypothetical protein
VQIVKKREKYLKQGGHQKQMCHLKCSVGLNLNFFKYWNVPVSTVVETMAMNHPEVATYRNKNGPLFLLNK